jgi:PAS domain-containing protein
MDALAEIYRDVGLPLGIGQWQIDLVALRLFWPRGIGLGGAAVGYVWASFDDVIRSHFAGDRARFMGYIEEIVRAQGGDRILTIETIGPSGEPIPLRISGRYVHDDTGTRIYGVMLALGSWQDLEDRAHDLSLTLDALFYAADSGMVVFDVELTIRRANRKAMAVLGVTQLDRPQEQIFAEMAARAPTEILGRLGEALRQRATVGGVYRTPGTLEAYRWRATPWGKSDLGARGVALVFNRLEDRRIEPIRTDRNAVLEHLRNPVMVLQPATGEISFANPAARTIFNMKRDGRHFVRNLADLCGRAIPAETYDEIRKGGQFVTLKLGARLSRIDGPAEELLVEYPH